MKVIKIRLVVYKFVTILLYVKEAHHHSADYITKYKKNTIFILSVHRF